VKRSNFIFASNGKFELIFEIKDPKLASEVICSEIAHLRDETEF